MDVRNRLRTLLPAARLKPEILAPALILLAGFCLRLVFFLQVKDNFLFLRPFLDAKFYHRWAVEVTAGDWAGMTRGVFVMSPGYSYFLAVLYTLFGVGIATAVFVQLLAGVFCGWLIYLLGRRLLSREAGLLGAALYLLYAPELFFESTLLKASLINAVNTGALLAAMLAHPAGWVLSGFLTGCSAHLRPTALLFFPVITFWLWRRSPRGGLAAAFFTGGLLLALAPVAIRNQLIGGEWVLTTAHGGMNFYTGNSPASRGPYEVLPFARSDPAFEQDDFLREARRLSKLNLTPAQASRYWYAETWRLVRQDPAREAVLLLKKAAMFFNGYEPPINMDFNFFRKQFGSVLALPSLTFTVLLPLAVLGMVRAAPHLLLLGYLTVIFLSNMVFFVSSEYRFPVVPVLSLYAGWGLHCIVRDIRERATKRLFSSGALFLLLLGFTSFDIYTNLLNLPSYKREVTAKSFYNLGVEYQKEGMDEEAIRAYLESVKLNPRDPETRNNLGIALARRGRLTEAIAQLEAAAPGLPGAYNNMMAHYSAGNALAERGEIAGAIAQYQETIRIMPNYADGHYQLGLMYAHEKKLLEAASSFEEAVRLRPGFAEAFVSLGNVLRNLGRHAEARQRYQQALALQPDFPGVLYNTGLSWQEQGQLDEAEKWYRKSLALDPGFWQAANNLGNIYYWQRNPREALVWYERAVAIHPGSAELHNNQGAALEALSQTEQAVESFEAALRLDPDFDDAHVNLAQALEKMQQPARAANHYREALRLRPGDNTLRQKLRGLEAAGYGPGR